MSDHAQTWHYGLVARYWAELNTDPGPEGDYYQSIIERFGQPALDVGCGTGRLLIPFREARLDVDGSDVSGDMLAHCRQKAEAAGLSVELYEQATHELELPRTYRTIIACGALGLGGDLDQAFEAIKRCYAHLEPGGVLAFDTELPWANAKFWSRWLKEGRQDLPDLWPPRAGSNLLDDGSDLRMSFRIVAVDPLTQVVTMQLRTQLWRNDEMMEEEVHKLTHPSLFPHETRMMLEQAGFDRIEMLGAHTPCSPWPSTRGRYTAAYTGSRRPPTTRPLSSLRTSSTHRARHSSASRR